VPPPHILSFAAGNGRWVWLYATPDQVELRTETTRGSTSTLATGSGWTEVALAGDEAWIASPKEGKLLRVSLRGGGAPQVGVEGLSDPGGLLVQGDALYWIEETTPKELALLFLPSAGPTARLCRRDAAGTITRSEPVPAGPEGPGPGDVLGMTDQGVFARIRRPTTTEFVRFPRQDGPPQRLAGVQGAQEAILKDGQLYWTGHSEEATPDSGLSALYRLGRDGKPELWTDWLPGAGHLAILGGQLYNASHYVYRVLGKLEPPEVTGTVPGYQVVGDGEGLVQLDGDRPPLRVHPRGR
jgi:hypothetical protein